MGLRGSHDSVERFSSYVEGLAGVIGHADRVGPLRDYCTGLMLPSARKSVEPMAAVTAPGRTAAQHQSLLHFVGQASWSDEKVLAKVCEMVLPAMVGHGPIEAWIIDDTGFPKKGKHSVGVARQYCGQLGKQDNCQAAVSLSIANRQASLPVRYRLYLPQDWADDSARRRKAHVPEEIVFQTKPEIALEQLRWACAAGPPRGTVLLDAGYGNHTALRTQISALGLIYAAGILSSTTVWASGAKPLPPKRWSGRGRRPTRLRRSAGHKPVSVKQLAVELPRRAWRTIGWREGTCERLTSRFARVRVRAAHRNQLHDEEWLLIEWPKGEKERNPLPRLSITRMFHSDHCAYGIARSLLLKWRRQFDVRAAGASRFVAAVVVPERPTVPPSSGRMEIVASNGRRVVVDAGVDVAALARVLDLLERR